MGYWALSDRVILVKFKGKAFDISAIQAYAPTTDADSVEMDSFFYEKVEAAMSQSKSQDIILGIGDLNTKVGECKEDDIVGPHGLGTRNEILVDWCKENDMVKTDTWFMNHKRRKYTWVSPNSNTRNQIDYSMINKRFRNAVKQSNSYPGTEINSDHNLVLAKVQIRLQEIEEEWRAFEETLYTSVEETIPKIKAKKKQKWMTDFILDMMEERRKVKGKDISKYKELDNTIKAKCKEERERMKYGKNGTSNSQWKC
ncbi:craniofacial development protein 2-like [Penaeus monodon]|uniref:craniofacial development protein 2-like n=1 Tax=Penaeus monodon TaxID=6687 RepID=UPI0018A741D0|nr:craniofacial development protein 2-like [Penaeus monodon]